MRHSESPRDRCLTTAVFCDSLLVMRGDDSLPDDVEILKRLLAARNAELARARAEVSSAEALIAHLRLTIEKMRRELYGSRCERKARLLDQMELELEELEAAAAEDELAAERAAASPEETTAVRGFSRKKPSRKPFPAHCRARESSCLVRSPARAAARPSSPSSARTYRDARGRSAAMEGGAVRAREVHLPRLRADLTGSGAVPRAVARICWAEPAGHDPVREVRAASATQPPIRTLRARGSELEPVDAGRSGWRLRRPFAPALRSHPRARVCRQPRARLSLTSPATTASSRRLAAPTGPRPRAKSRDPTATSARTSSSPARSAISTISMPNCGIGSTRLPILACMPPRSAWSMRPSLKRSRISKRCRSCPSARSSSWNGAFLMRAW